MSTDVILTQWFFRSYFMNCTHNLTFGNVGCPKSLKYTIYEFLFIRNKYANFSVEYILLLVFVFFNSSPSKKGTIYDISQVCVMYKARSMLNYIT